MLRHALLLLAFAGCGLAASLPLPRLVRSGPMRTVRLASERIAGGQDATSGQFPYQVSLQLSEIKTRQHMCGGSIISTTRVLTAAYCIVEIFTYYAVAGGVDISNESGTEQVVEIAEQIPHPDYNGTTLNPPNDIAVFTLTSAFTINSYVQIVPLASSGSIPTANSTAIASGWGATEDTLSSNILQWVEVTIIDIPTCQNLTADLGEPDIVVDNLVCSDPVAGINGICGGDTGGPLVQDGQLIGVSVWAFVPCGHFSSPSGFTRVSAFIDFITENM